MYEYKCQACHHRFEKIQKFSDAPVKKCPKCGKSKVEKLISKSSIQFKGTGWYITDYAAKNAPKEESKTETTADKKTEEKTEAKSETKAETKSETGSEAKSETSDKPKKKESKKTKV